MVVVFPPNRGSPRRRRQRWRWWQCCRGRTASRWAGSAGGARLDDTPFRSGGGGSDLEHDGAERSPPPLPRAPVGGTRRGQQIRGGERRHRKSIEFLLIILLNSNEMAYSIVICRNFTMRLDLVREIYCVILSLTNLYGFSRATSKRTFLQVSIFFHSLGLKLKLL
jgi:hypothetical protein